MSISSRQIDKHWSTVDFSSTHNTGKQEASAPQKRGRIWALLLLCMACMGVSSWTTQSIIEGNHRQELIEDFNFQKRTLTEIKPSTTEIKSLLREAIDRFDSAQNKRQAESISDLRTAISLLTKAHSLATLHSSHDRQSWSRLVALVPREFQAHPTWETISTMANEADQHWQAERWSEGRSLYARVMKQAKEYLDSCLDPTQKAIIFDPSDKILAQLVNENAELRREITTATNQLASLENKFQAVNREKNSLQEQIEVIESERDELKVLLQGIEWNREPTSGNSAKRSSSLKVNGLQLGFMAYGRGDHRSAINYWKLEIDRGGQVEAAINNIAWLLATSPYNDIRNGHEAIHLMSLILRVSGNSKEIDNAHKFFVTWNRCGVMAAAQAEIGNFAAARKWQIKALSMCPSEKKEECRHRLRLYERYQPYRLPVRS